MRTAYSNTTSVHDYSFYGMWNEREVGKSTETQKSPISPNTSQGKKYSTKNIIKDITSDSQVKNIFPHRCHRLVLHLTAILPISIFIYNKNNDT